MLTVTFSLSKNKESSATQDTEEETSGVKKEELELDPLLSAVPPPSIKQELQEDGFVRPKNIAVKSVKYILSTQVCMLDCICRPMEINVFKVPGVQQTKPVIKSQFKEEGYVCIPWSALVSILCISSSKKRKISALEEIKMVR